MLLKLGVVVAEAVGVPVTVFVQVSEEVGVMLELAVTVPVGVAVGVPVTVTVKVSAEVAVLLKLGVAD